jgi:hypothetical protein
MRRMTGLVILRGKSTKSKGGYRIWRRNSDEGKWGRKIDTATIYEKLLATADNTRLAAHCVRPNRFAASPIWVTLAEIRGQKIWRKIKWN